MHEKTIEKAYRILPTVKLVECLERLFHFTVVQNSGQICHVFYYINTFGVGSWSCNAVGVKKDGTKFGCVYNTLKSSKPFCSHTKACDIYMVERRWEALQNTE